MMKLQGKGYHCLLIIMKSLVIRLCRRGNKYHRNRLRLIINPPKIEINKPKLSCLLGSPLIYLLLEKMVAAIISLLGRQK